MKGICTYCGIESNNARRYQGNDIFCNRHYRQLMKFGKVKRTRNDPPNIIKHDYYCEVSIYNTSGEEIAKTLIDNDDLHLLKGSLQLFKGYVKLGNGQLLHRAIMQAPCDKVVDHIYHNTLDNRKSKLRICTQTENCQNIQISTANTSGVIGVWFDNSRGKWAAEIKVNGKKTFLGRFNDFEYATQARRNAELEYFGEFAPRRDYS